MRLLEDVIHHRIQIVEHPATVRFDLGLVAGAVFTGSHQDAAQSRRQRTADICLLYTSDAADE